MSSSSSLPTSKLSPEHARDLVEAVEKARMSTESFTVEVHGWLIAWTLRPKGAATRGDLCVRPADGSAPLYSLISIKRKLGLVESAPASGGSSGKSAEDQRSAAADRSKRERVNVHAKAYGQESIGLRVSIKWEGEGKWFKGVVKEYNPVTFEHTVVCEPRPVRLPASPRLDPPLFLMIFLNPNGVRIVTPLSCADEDGDQQQHNLGIEESVKQLKWLQEIAPAKKKLTGEKRKKGEGADGASSPQGKPLKPPPKNYRPPLPPPKARIKIKSSGLGPPDY